MSLLGFRRPAHAEWLMLLLCVVCLLLAIHVGSTKVTLKDWSAVWQDKQLDYVLWQLRIPRVLFAALIGALLGLAGALTQGLFRNPLADPGLLGISSGAACAVALSIVFGHIFDLNLSVQARYWSLPIAAFVGAVVVCFALDLISRLLVGRSITGLLLTGIALNALASGVIGLATYVANDEQLRGFAFWTLGSLSAANWWLVLSAALLLLGCRWYSQFLLNTLNALSLGEHAAAQVGVKVLRLRYQIIGLVAVLSGFAVAWCGMIGFIGLVAPHLVRTVCGANQRYVIPLAMWVGAILLLLADTAARTVALPAEIPVGVFSALIGAPFFLFLLLKTRQSL